jgi:hypothetical protein
MLPPDPAPFILKHDRNFDFLLVAVTGRIAGGVFFGALEVARTVI